MHLSALNVYPIKSCRGTKLQQAEVGPRGIEADRRWMVVTPTGRFLTQRKHPRMALIEPELSGDALVIRAPGMEPLRLARGAGGPTVRVEIWKDRCDAMDQGEEVAEWLSSFLNAPRRLVRQADDAHRTADPAYVRSGSPQVSFADGYPFLLTGEASLADLNARLFDPVPMNRFRPNLVVSGSAPWEEDGWRRIRIGDLDFDVVKPCARCVITTVDQATGEKGKEPLGTLAGFRRDIPGAPPGSSGNVYFGQNLIHRREGVLEVGAEVEVLEVGAEAEVLEAGDEAEVLGAGAEAEVLEVGAEAEVLEAGEEAEVLEAEVFEADREV